jgi:ArsR family transcriptional regulator, arsenate/arsenite/antimonite-responsive transcriptional repressor
MTDEQQQMARFARAMAHPVRIYILELLAGQSCCYSGDLAEELPIARSTLSQHLKTLKDAGLIQGEINPPKIKYCIDRENWDKAKFLFSGLFDEKYIKNSSTC